VAENSNVGGGLVPGYGDAWPERLKVSAAALASAAQALNEALADRSRFDALTAPSDVSDHAAAQVREFHRLIRVALAALVDLSAHDNPDQEFPDLTTWFEFKCPNVVYGQHTDLVPPA
jgi:hypothetical protein